MPSKLPAVRFALHCKSPNQNNSRDHSRVLNLRNASNFLPEEPTTQLFKCRNKPCKNSTSLTWSCQT